MVKNCFTVINNRFRQSNEPETITITIDIPPLLTRYLHFCVVVVVSNDSKLFYLPEIIVTVHLYEQVIDPTEIWSCTGRPIIIINDSALDFSSGRNSRGR